MCIDIWFQTSSNKEEREPYNDFVKKVFFDANVVLWSLMGSLLTQQVFTHLEKDQRRYAWQVHIE